MTAPDAAPTTGHDLDVAADGKTTTEPTETEET